MIFGAIPVRRAEGAILAHSASAGALVMKKGRVLSAADVAALQAAGVDTVIAARLEATDVPEDEAARRLADAIAGPGTSVTAAFTGRANLYAACPGLARIEASRIDRLNRVHESLTLATVAPFEVVRTRQMLATVKVIPFAAPAAALDASLAIAAEGEALIRVAPFRNKRIALVSTSLPGMKPALLDKNRAALERRLEDLSGHVVHEARVAHREAAIAEGIGAALAARAEIVLIFGASAIVDRRDEVPAGLVAAGGTVEHFGMPVDPGNLLLLGHRGEVAVIGLPGCARSPKINGFDFVLQRLLADIPVTPGDIAGMGVGGLLKEIPTRPQPRDRPPLALPHAPRVAGLLLAAGLSRRMGPVNKLLADYAGKPLVRHAAEALLASEARPVLVVTGHERAAVERALAGLPLRFVHNPHFADGLSTSLKAGIAALAGDEIDAALVALGDMPLIKPAALNTLIAAFNPTEGRGICVPTRRGQRGNPVLWGRDYFAALGELTGDAGARALIGAFAEAVCEIEQADDAVLTDIDKPEALAMIAKGSPP